METLTLYLILSTVVEKAVEWVRSKYAGLDGDYVRLAAVALGTLAAWGAGIDLESVLADQGFVITDLPDWLSYLGSGAAIGFGAGAIADLLGRSGGDIIVEETVIDYDPDYVGAD